ncbi:MAG TPA: ribonuclease H [Gemmatimonadales bacterium]|nr:ribonuclease H [Gemmatimonadales bacterium]
MAHARAIRGTGGYGVVIRYERLGRKPHRKEFSGGFRLTTNNRMELMSVIVGLQQLKEPCEVELHSESKYITSSSEGRLPQKWKQAGWRRKKRGRVLNPDLWQRISELSEKAPNHTCWVASHSGDEENERCDQLAVSAANQRDLPPDVVYERENRHF